MEEGAWFPRNEEVPEILAQDGFDRRLPWREPPRKRPTSLHTQEAVQQEEETSPPTFYATGWVPDEDLIQSSLPSEVLAMEALHFRSTAWEDEGTLQWSTFVNQETQGVH